MSRRRRVWVPPTLGTKRPHVRLGLLWAVVTSVAAVAGPLVLGLWLAGVAGAAAMQSIGHVKGKGKGRRRRRPDRAGAAAAAVLPPGSTVELAGESREFQESSGALYFAFALALVFVFMVLAAQFESLLHPFTVLLAVPLAVTGALAALWLAGSTLNVYSQIGMILLIGLVTKNSILLVTYAKDLRDRGYDALAAMREAGRIRLRPILMTSVASIFGALPIALGLGAGAGSRRPLGYSIVGGLIVSTLLTLFLVPAVYVVFERLRERRMRAAATNGSGGVIPGEYQPVATPATVSMEAR